VRDKSVGRGLKRRGGQRVTEIRLVKPNDAQSRGYDVGAKPAERQLIGGGEDHQNVRSTVPFVDDAGVSDGELEGGMSGLTSLITRWQIVTGDQIQARGRNLTVRHGLSLQRLVNPPTASGLG
jgi:hypothetical protein